MRETVPKNTAENCGRLVEVATAVAAAVVHNGCLVSHKDCDCFAFDEPCIGLVLAFSSQNPLPFCCSGNVVLLDPVPSLRESGFGCSQHCLRIEQLSSLRHASRSLDRPRKRHRPSLRLLPSLHRSQPRPGVDPVEGAPGPQPESDGRATRAAATASRAPLHQTAQGFRRSRRYLSTTSCPTPWQRRRARPRLFEDTNRDRPCRGLSPERN